MKIKRGMKFRSKGSGRVIVVKRKATGHGHWDCACGKKNHKIHEGTLRKYYETLDAPI